MKGPATVGEWVLWGLVYLPVHMATLVWTLDPGGPPAVLDFVISPVVGCAAAIVALSLSRRLPRRQDAPSSRSGGAVRP